MARWLRSVASLLTLVTVAGTPAMLSACVALCMPGMDAHVAVGHTADTSMPTHHAAPAVETSAPACAEHGATAIPVAVDAQVSRTGDHCCAEGLTAPAASSTASRADTHLLVVAVAPLRVSWTSGPKRAPVTRRHDPAAPPPSPPRTSVVLRI